MPFCHGPVFPEDAFSGDACSGDALSGDTSSSDASRKLGTDFDPQDVAANQKGQVAKCRNPKSPW
jgi:hypothetical protein